MLVLNTFYNDISVDPIGLAGGINPYSYVRSNPVWAADPSGLKSMDQTLDGGGGGGGAIVVVVGIGLGCLISDTIDKFKDRFFSDNSSSGAKDAPPVRTDRPTEEWIYGPQEDPKINPDGSTKPDTWTTPEDYSDRNTAVDKLDPFKPVEGRRPVVIPAGTDVQRGKTPGKEGPYKGSGGARETLIPSGLPPGSVGTWRPLP